MTQQTFIGVPCKRGHSGLRFTSTHNCVQCTKDMSAQRAKQQRLRNPEKAKARVTRYHSSEKGKAAIAAYNTSDARKAALKKYNESAKGIAAKQRYAGTDKQRACQNRAQQAERAILARRLRNRIRQAVKRSKNGKRAGSAVRDLGCSIADFKSFISSKFQDGMTWDNYGEWHLDHIKPIALYDLSNRVHFLEVVHYTNYQPLWAQDNWRKAAKLLEAT